MSRRVQYSLLIFLMLGLLCFQFYGTRKTPTQSTSHYEKAVVISTEMVEVTDHQGTRQGQSIHLRLLTGPETGKEVESFNNLLATPLNFDRLISPGDRVFISVTENNEAKSYYFSDFDRTPYFLILFVILVLGLLFFGRTVGLRSLLAMGIALIMLWHWFIAHVLEPTVNIYSLAVIFCACISCIILVIISGITRKTLAALLGTLGGLAFASLLSFFSIKIMHLTGIDTEEAYMLKAHIMPLLNFRGILFASIIIGSLGAIIDVTISVASAQVEIHQSSPEITPRQLYSRGMNVGKDIMGATSTTLLLAYVGSSLPLLLMMARDKALPFDRTINLPFVMTELARAVIGSIGLTYAIPLTSLIMTALLIYGRRD